MLVLAGPDARRPRFGVRRWLRYHGIGVAMNWISKASLHLVLAATISAFATGCSSNGNKAGTGVGGTGGASGGTSGGGGAAGGPNVCGPNQYCCKETCGLCLPMGAACPARVCVDGGFNSDAETCIAVPAGDSQCSGTTPHLYTCFLASLPAPCVIRT